MTTMKRYFAIAAMALTSLTAFAGPHSQSKDIVDTAVSAGSFTTLAKALKAADLVDTLKGSGPFTVFAPSDEAFARMTPATLEQLMKPENKDSLRAVLTYHVVPGRLAAKDVAKVGSLKTVNGQDLRVTSFSPGVQINNAKITSIDITASNGIIHVIDQVVIPDFDNKASVGKVGRLLAEFEQQAADMRRDASFLEAKRRGKLSWTTHADRLTIMKKHANESGQLLSELESMKPQASLLQQRAIEAARPHLEKIASDLNSAIQMLNGNRRIISKPEYLSTLHSVWTSADTLYKQVDAITDYKEAQKRLNTMLASAR